MCKNNRSWARNYHKNPMTQEEFDSRVCQFVLPSGEICGGIPHRTGTREDGVVRRTPYICTPHHQHRLAKKHDVPTYSGLTGPSSEYRDKVKTYCENTDGRLGFVCTTTIINKTKLGLDWYGMLDVDHIDGNPYNQSSENCQTLCKCCHAYKTLVNRDTATPGRKSLKKDAATKLAEEWLHSGNKEKMLKSG